MRIFANTIYSPGGVCALPQLPASNRDKGHLYASLGVTTTPRSPSEPLGAPRCPSQPPPATTKDWRCGYKCGQWKLRGENADSRAVVVEFCRAFNMAPTPFAFGLAPLSSEAPTKSRSSSSCTARRRNEMQFKCLGYKLLSQQAASSQSRSTRTSLRDALVGCHGEGCKLANKTQRKCHKKGFTVCQLCAAAELTPKPIPAKTNQSQHPPLPGSWSIPLTLLTR